MDAEVLAVLAALNVEAAKDLVAFADRNRLPVDCREMLDVETAVTPVFRDGSETAIVSLTKMMAGEPDGASVEIRDLIAMAVFGARVVLGAVEKIPTEIPD